MADDGAATKKHAAPLPPPIAEYGVQQKKIVLTPEQLEKGLERLYGQSVKAHSARKQQYDEDTAFQMQHNDITYKKVRVGELSEAEQKAVTKLYTQPMERRAAAQASLDKKFAPVQPAVHTVSPEEKDQITERLYSTARHKASLEESARRIYGAPQEPRVLDKEQLAANIDSCYTKAVAKKKEADAALEAEYGWKRKEQKPLTPAEIAALGARLATKSGK